MMENKLTYLYLYSRTQPIQPTLLLAIPVNPSHQDDAARAVRTNRHLAMNAAKSDGFIYVGQK